MNAIVPHTHWPRPVLEMSTTCVLTTRPFWRNVMTGSRLSPTKTFRRPTGQFLHLITDYIERGGGGNEGGIFSYCTTKKRRNYSRVVRRLDSTSFSSTTTRRATCVEATSCAQALDETSTHERTSSRSKRGQRRK